jgi:hypothetical protein
MKADMETDEVFAQMTLQPVNDVSIYISSNVVANQHFPFPLLFLVLFTNLLKLS